jgi:hypothetical protein
MTMTSDSDSKDNALSKDFLCNLSTALAEFLWNISYLYLKYLPISLTLNDAGFLEVFFSEK